MSRPTFVFGGLIHTMSAAGTVSSMLVRDGRICAVGPREALESLVPAHCEMLDLGGATVVPGMHDSHIHLNMWSVGRSQVDLKDAKTMAEGLQIIKEACEEAAPGEWVLGGRWDKSLWVNFPDRKDLDKVSFGHPVYLSSKDGHSGWANSLALAMAHIDESTPSPAGGALLKDDTGRLTGILQDTAKGMLSACVPRASREKVAISVADGIKHLQSLGLTGCHVVDGISGFVAAQDLQSKGLLDFRLACCPPVQALQEVKASGLRQGFGNDYVFLGPVKMFKDGALGSSTAYMLEPYQHIPGYRGLEVMTHDQLVEAVKTSISAGFGAGIHAIGDLACRDVLDVLEVFTEESKALSIRHRVEHAQLLTERDVPRFAELGVIASVQPSHAVADRFMADREWGSRASWAYPFESLRRSGAVLAFGSDAPVDDPDPIYGIHCAVNRNAPGEDESSAWYPQERVSAYDALCAYTVGAAYSIGKEQSLGDLSPGKLADFVVLSEDILSVPKSRIRAIKVLATVVGGKKVYEATI